ncbi:Dual specificity tyrosine-phosphorylation-regulated kinase 2 [Orchesella cincta]|uniref:dual-specificity kinase n=1 Tax=Orchesella cincta TaxID=48709 RepID=A0A1D2M3Y8_ORCCI|nr:Dual specificity tyrosine-phosphorylation-regulated kinase 2 [Orchesella cincta]
MEFNHGGSTRGSKRPRDSEEGRRLGDHHPATKQSKASGKYMSPQQALTQHGSKLTRFERAEIVTFPQIYYLGLEANKIGQIVSTTSGPNDGYDDSEKFYINRMHDHISYRYELLESLGKGDTSQVFKAVDHKTGAQVALKIIRNEDHLQTQAEKEVFILTQLKNNVNVVEILDSFQFRNHSCIVFELLARNLSRLKFETCYKGFTPLQVKKFIIPVLQCLQGLSQKQIVHGDLNLENILLKQEYRDEIKGCAYRAPELILGIEYGRLLTFARKTRRIIYRRRHELRSSLLMRITSFRLIVRRKQKEWEEDFGVEEEGKWEDKRSSGNEGFRTCAGNGSRCQANVFGFVKRCLEWVPEARLKPSQALVHPWIKKMRSKSQTKNGNEGERRWSGSRGNVAA